jgi:hypothetical protein
MILKEESILYDYFFIGCIISIVLFVIIQLIGHGNKGQIIKDSGKKRFRGVFYMMLFPSLLTVASGASCFLDIPDESMLFSVIVLISDSFILVLDILYFIYLRKEKNGLVKRILRSLSLTGMSAPASLLVGMSLRLFEIGKDSAPLICMSATVFGGMAFLVSLNMIVVSYCEYSSTIESWKLIKREIQDKKLLFVRASIVKDFFLVIVKVILSIISSSVFMFANALFSVGMGIARYYALKMHAQKYEEQIKSYQYVGMIISGASLCYILYSIRLIFGGSMTQYPMSIALIIACYTFVEFGINIKGILGLRESKALEAKALRAIGFAGTLLCFVLTQVTIMSFASEGDHHLSNALSGIIFGSCAGIIGIYVIIKSVYIKKRQ